MAHVVAADRSQAEEAYAGDIIDCTITPINIETRSRRGALHVHRVPNFAPEIFRRAVLKDRYA